MVEIVEEVSEEAEAEVETGFKEEREQRATDNYQSEDSGQ